MEISSELKALQATRSRLPIGSKNVIFVKACIYPTDTIPDGAGGELGHFQVKLKNGDRVSSSLQIVPLHLRCAVGGSMCVNRAELHEVVD